MSAVAARTADGVEQKQDDLDHICCCRDENLAFCLRDLTDVPFTAMPTRPCVVCADLEGTGYCPRSSECSEPTP